MTAIVPAEGPRYFPRWRASQVCSAAASLALLAGFGSSALAQTPKFELPDPSKTDPVGLELMKGFPPPADKIVTLANTFKFPNGRWAYQHLRELGPTVAVWRGEASPTSISSEMRNMDAIIIETGT